MMCTRREQLPTKGPTDAEQPMRDEPQAFGPRLLLALAGALSLLGLLLAVPSSAQRPGAIDEYKPAPPSGGNPQLGVSPSGKPGEADEPSTGPASDEGATASGGSGSQRGGSGHKRADGAGASASRKAGGSLDANDAGDGVSKFPLIGYPSDGVVVLALALLLIAIGIRAAIAGYRRFGPSAGT